MRRSAKLDVLALHLHGIDQALSRTTATGTAAIGVHASKRPALLAGDDLKIAIDRNRLLSAEFIIWQAAHPPLAADGVAAALIGLAWLVNLGIIDGGLYRGWPYNVPAPPGGAPWLGVAPSEIAVGVAELAAECLTLNGQSAAQRPRRIARIEWEIGVGPLHPFYDGCGRASRYFSTLLCLWQEIPLPIHTSREAYMKAATTGEAAFADYWTSVPCLTLAELAT